MNTKFIFLLLVVTNTMMLFDTKPVEGISCTGSKQCYDPCKRKTGCPNAKCMNKSCKCYGCG
uniref:Kv1.3 potassium channel blocker n=1 Tax=Heterometrus laoticus TaxID=217256 RepID=I6NWV2_HETLA|nr:Kv1.3 potassium channel blocker precursor [Heterometrus laoticus]